MSNSDPGDFIRGSGNVFADFDRPNSDAEQLRAVLAAHIIEILDTSNLTVRRAEELTGVAAADFSRIRRAKLERFTIDRLMAILARFEQRIDVAVTFRPRSAA